MGFLAERSQFALDQGSTTHEYELDRYVLEYGYHGYLKRMVVDGTQIVGSEYREIKQLNFADPGTVPGPLCVMKTLYGRKPYVVALSEHPHALYLAQNQLTYNVSYSSFWKRERMRDIPDLGVVYGNVMVGFFSPEPPPEEKS